MVDKWLSVHLLIGVLTYTGGVRLVGIGDARGSDIAELLPTSTCFCNCKQYQSLDQNKPNSIILIIDNLCEIGHEFAVLLLKRLIFQLQALILAPQSRYVCLNK